MQDYAVGRKDFSTATLTATVVASWLGGDDEFYILENTYTDGLYFVIVILSAEMCLLLSGQLALRMGEFFHNLSVAEAMGDLYGKTVRMLTAMSGILFNVGIVAMQFKVIAEIIASVFGIDRAWVMSIASVIVIAYSVSGGIRAVTFTDVLQFFCVWHFCALACTSDLESS